MEKEENLKVLTKRNLYKISLVALKILPILLALLTLIVAIIDSVGLTSTIINYIIYFILFAYLYIVSYVFQFCEYHRMFLHYIVITHLLKIYDVYIGIPLSNVCIFKMYGILTCICLIIILVLYVKSNKKDLT